MSAELDSEAPVSNAVFALRISELSPRRKVTDLEVQVTELKEQISALTSIIEILGKTVSEQSVQLNELRSMVSSLQEYEVRRANDEEQVLAELLG